MKEPVWIREIEALTFHAQQIALFGGSDGVRDRGLLNSALARPKNLFAYAERELTMEDKPIALRRLLSHTRSERALIAMFLALLELVRLQAILLRQDRAFSEIFIKKHTGFDALMNEGLSSARDDWR